MEFLNSVDLGKLWPPLLVCVVDNRLVVASIFVLLEQWENGDNGDIGIIYSASIFCISYHIVFVAGQSKYLFIIVYACL